MAIRVNRSSGWSFAERDQKTTLANEPANASEMRAFVCDFLEAERVPTHVVDEVLMAVGEVVANACRHGRPSSGHGHVQVQCGLRGQAVVVRITDDGPGFDVDKILHGGIPDVLSQGGRGFFLMRQLMDKVDVQSDDTGTTVILERHLPR